MKGNENDRGFIPCSECQHPEWIGCHGCPRGVRFAAGDAEGWRLDHVGGVGCLALCPDCRPPGPSTGGHRGQDWTDEDIAYGIELPWIFDGVSVWVLKDGRRINRFAGLRGYGRRAERIQAHIDRDRDQGRRGRQ